MRSLFTAVRALVMAGCTGAFRTEKNSALHATEKTCKPGDSISCHGENGTGVKKCDADGMNWGECGNLTACDSGYNLQSGVCVANLCTPAATRSCSIANGTGAQTCNGSGSAWDYCALILCDPGYTAYTGACFRTSRSCAIANGTGTQTFMNGAYGTCQLTSCNAGYTSFSGACYQTSQSCAIANGTGTQTFSNGVYGTCQLTSCDGGYTAYNNACFRTSQSCAIANGTGTQTFMNGAYGGCQVSACNAGFKVNNLSNSCQPVPFQSASVTQMQTLLAGLYALYSPDQFGALLFLGGWLNIDDYNRPNDYGTHGDDRLYVSSFLNGSWQTPAPIEWTNPGYTPGYVPGYHANDPSLVYRADVNWHFMYYTALPDQFNHSLAQILSYNWIGFASSSDGGRTWMNHGIVIGEDNGLDKTGAWNPSALLANGEIWIYYHTGAGCNFMDCHVNAEGVPTTSLPPRILRTRVNVNGWQSIATQAMTDWNGGPLSLINPNIRFAYGRYWLAANSGLNRIVLYLSDDGVRFYPFNGGDAVLIDGGPNQVLTPNIQILSPNVFTLQFGFQGGTSIQQWTMQLQ